MERALSMLTLALRPTATAATPDNALVLQSATDVPTLDPVMTSDTGSGQYVENIYETLYQDKGSSVRDLHPLLATGHKASNGGKTHAFDLRQNVKFHSGNPFTCADAEYTFRRTVVNDAESWR